MTDSKAGYVLSAGDFCIIDLCMRRCGMKKEDGPFDSLFGNIAFFTDCISTDMDMMRDMMDRLRTTYFRSYPGTDYEHPRLPDVDIKDGEIHEFFGRAMVRYREILKSHDRKLLFHIRGQYDAHPTDIQIKELMQTLRDSTAQEYIVCFLRLKNKDDRDAEHPYELIEDNYSETFASGYRSYDVHIDCPLEDWRSDSCLDTLGLALKMICADNDVVTYMQSQIHDDRDENISRAVSDLAQEYIDSGRSIVAKSRVVEETKPLVYRWY